MTSLIRRTVAAETGRLPLNAYDTVLRDTPTRLAISPMFMPVPVSGPSNEPVRPSTIVGHRLLHRFVRHGYVGAAAPNRTGSMNVVNEVGRKDQDATRGC